MKHVPQGYQPTQLGIIPKDWEVHQLSSLGHSFSGLKGKKKDDFGKGKPYIPYMNIFKNTIIDENHFDYVQIAKNEKQHKVLHGDVFFTTSSETPEEVGMPSVYIGNLSELYLNSFCFGFRLHNPDNALPIYLCYFFRGTLGRKLIKRLAQGATRFNLSKNLLKQLIPLPPLPEQQKIAAILTTWDNAIAANQSIIHTLTRRNKGLAQQLLTGKKRLKGFQEQWYHKQLEQFFKERKETGYIDLPLLSIRKSGVHLQSESNEKDTSNSNKSKYKRICIGDIGYNTMRMWQGRSALSQLEGIISPAYTVVIPNNNAEVYFFAFLFKLEAVIHKFFRNSQGLVSDTLNCKFKDFKLVKVSVPPSLEEQKAIAKVLLDAAQEVKLYKKKLDKLQEQKKGLMQKLLTGSIRIKA